jgi:glycosyltransferase involved in cell wall biosynthesis
MDRPEPDGQEPRVTIIVPARNEEASLGACLQSLTRQTGLSLEIIVVDDGSTDRTRAIAQAFPNVEVIEAPPLPPAWTGKNNAVIAGAAQARGQWLLFTDADTVHKPGSLARALLEAQQHGASLLSYSPEQEVHGLWERAVMPVVFAELAETYPPSKVSEPSTPHAAANGQYLLVSREAYDVVGGHAAVSTVLLEDVALARLVKQSGRRILFRYGGDAVRTRMYRSFAQLREGWIKNLALLFPRTGRRALISALEFFVILGGVALTLAAFLKGAFQLATLVGAASILLHILFLRRIRHAHFSWKPNLLAIFGLPVFSYLLVLSRLSHQRGSVRWKGRLYKRVEEARTGTPRGEPAALSGRPS